MVPIRPLTSVELSMYSSPANPVSYLIVWLAYDFYEDVRRVQRPLGDTALQQATSFMENEDEVDVQT